MKTGEAVLRVQWPATQRGYVDPRRPAATGQDADINGKADGPTGTPRVHASGFDAVADLSVIYRLSSKRLGSAGPPS